MSLPNEFSPTRFSRGLSIGGGAQTAILPQTIKYKRYMDYVVNLYGIEIDFTGKLETPAQYAGSFESMLQRLKHKNVDIRESAMAEIEARISAYAHKYFSRKGYLNHATMGVWATEEMMKRITNN